jgi:hypothetical protein
MARWSRRRSTASTCWTVPPFDPQVEEYQIVAPIAGG